MGGNRRGGDGPWTTLVVFIGALIPCLLAVTLIAVFAREDTDPQNAANPTSLQETVRVPFDAEEATLTAAAFAGTVRVIVEGSGRTPDGLGFDAFYQVPAAEGDIAESAPESVSALAIDGEPALAALGLEGDPPNYAPDHVYAVLYDAGPSARRLAFRALAPAAEGAFTITVIQLR